MTTNTLKISPRILQWVAQQSGISVDKLVDLVGSESNREKRKAGELTVNQIEKLSKKFHIPFGYFFLDHPPNQIFSTIPDLRQLKNSNPLSIDFFETLNDVIRKQDWYEDYLQAMGVEKLDFVGKFKLIDNVSNISVEQIVKAIHKTLGVSVDQQIACKNANEFFNLLNQQSEEAGILIFRNGVVKNNTRRPLLVAEFRGFALVNDYAPAIFINGQDSKTAQIFTLAHELAHIFLGRSGISDLPDLPDDPFDKEIEQFCNQIAAELLTPRELFLEKWAVITEKDKISALSRLFNVSDWVIARRAYELNKIDKENYLQIINHNINYNKNQKQSGGNFYRTCFIRNSRRVTEAILRMTLNNDTMLRDAASLLNTTPDNVMKLARRHFPNEYS